MGQDCSVTRRITTIAGRTGAGLAVMLLAGCQGVPERPAPEAAAPSTSAVAIEEAVISAPPAPPGYDAGSYLAAHQATVTGDIDTAANRYTVALASDPDSTRLLERSFRSLYVSGQVENAGAIASTLEKMGKPVSLGSEPAAAIAARNADWAGLEVIARHLTEDSASRALGIAFEAWAFVFQERGDAGLSKLLELEHVQSNGAPPELLFTQFALMMEYLGKPEDALEAARIAIKREGARSDTIVMMAGVLARNGAVDEAERHLRGRLNRYYPVDSMVAGLASGASSLMARPGTLTLLSNAAIDIALIDENAMIAQIARLQLADYLDGGFDRSRYHLGRALRQAEMIEDGVAIHAEIASTSPWFQPAQLLNGLYYSSTRKDYAAAAGIFDQLITIDPSNPLLWRFAGDNARRHDAFKTAIEAYATAITLGGNAAKLNYYRGIAFDHLEQDDAAEAAFRESLNLNPDDAYVLNYLGYWLLEHGGNAEEALTMIRRAVEAQPRNGFFMDSLGWGYYRLGRYRQALMFLERAVTLEPADPTITDHLGDAYQKTGRLREAVYEWKRALYYADDTVDPALIQAKIDAAERRMAP